MATSPLLGGDRAPRRPPGTGTDLLGPSDSSDSGSDLVGADGAVETDDLGLDGNDIRRARGAGADVGDANLDSDSDRSGTGERAEAGRDTLRSDAPDISPDRVVDGPRDQPVETDEEALADVDELASEDDDESLDADDVPDDRGSRNDPI